MRDKTPTRFSDIDSERINVVEQDDRTRLVFSGADNSPGIAEREIRSRRAVDVPSVRLVPARCTPAPTAPIFFLATRKLRSPTLERLTLQAEQVTDPPRVTAHPRSWAATRLAIPNASDES